MSGTVAKHVVIMEQLSNHVTNKNLLEVSELQQQIACDIQSSQHTQVSTKSFYTCTLFQINLPKMPMKACTHIVTLIVNLPSNNLYKG